MRDTDIIKPSGKWVGVSLDDPICTMLCDDHDEALEAMAQLEAEGDLLGEWVPMEFSVAALAEYNSNGGDISELSNSGGRIITEAEHKALKAAGLLSQDAWSPED